MEDFIDLTDDLGAEPPTRAPAPPRTTAASSEDPLQPVSVAAAPRRRRTRPPRAPPNDDVEELEVRRVTPTPEQLAMRNRRRRQQYRARQADPVDPDYVDMPSLVDELPDVRRRPATRYLGRRSAGYNGYNHAHGAGGGAPLPRHHPHPHPHQQMYPQFMASANPNLREFFRIMDRVPANSELHRAFEADLMEHLMQAGVPIRPEFRGAPQRYGAGDVAGAADAALRNALATSMDDYSAHQAPPVSALRKPDIPTETREGYTRAVGDARPPVCVRCEQQLGIANKELPEAVQVASRRIYLRNCGHVYCGSCVEDLRSATRKTCPAPNCHKRGKIQFRQVYH